jgi:hypothetical protein
MHFIACPILGKCSSINFFAALVSPSLTIKSTNTAASSLAYLPFPSNNRFQARIQAEFSSALAGP